MGPDVTPYEMKKFIIETLALEDMKPEDIGDDEPLFAGGLGLDSIDGLELDVALRKAFRLQPPAEATAAGGKHLRSVSSIMAYVACMASA